jgi:predicted unusual protein kinase regulating ubiquinone biosynthesis (AarF/ABC1/UbiB family)
MDPRPNLRRLAALVRVLAAHLAAHALGAGLARRPWLARRLPPGDLSGPERVRTLIEDLGGTFVKFGQMLALQPDILSLEYCDALLKLLDRVEPFPYQDVDRVVREELGRSPEEVFDRFERRPIATASIGQVHVAYRGQRKLAVKIQRPAVETEFAGDIRLMSVGMTLIRRLRLKPLFWLLEPMSEFVGWTREELDYRYEARYLEQLRRNAADNLCEEVPAAVAELCTRRILTVEFLDGLTVLDFLRAQAAGDALAAARLAAWGFDANRFARHMIDNFLGDAFRHGIFHADLHPANLMILRNNTVGYIDFGITGVLSRYARRSLMALTLAYTRGDLESMGTAFQRVSVPGDRFDRGAFRAGLERLGEEWYEGKERRLRKNFTLMMLDMLRLSRQTDIWPEREVVKYIRSSIAIDGLITRFAPRFDIGAYLAEACDRYLQADLQESLASYDGLFTAALAGGHLVRDGASRLAAVLDRIADGDLVLAERPADARDADAALRGRVVRLACLVLAAAASIAIAGREPRWGVNLFSAAAAVGAVALARLGLAAWALGRSAPGRLVEG